MAALAVTILHLTLTDNDILRVVECTKNNSIALSVTSAPALSTASDQLATKQFPCVFCLFLSFQNLVRNFLALLDYFHHVATYTSVGCSRPATCTKTVMGKHFHISQHIYLRACTCTFTTKMGRKTLHPATSSDLHVATWVFQI